MGEHYDYWGGENAAVPVPGAGDDITVHTVQLDLCELCIRGEGGECHVPGCAMWINHAPDLPLDNHPSFRIVPLDAGDDTLRERLACDADRLEVKFGWIVYRVDEHTCGAGGSESAYQHEPTCGYEPLKRINVRDVITETVGDLRSDLLARAREMEEGCDEPHSTEQLIDEAVLPVAAAHLAEKGQATQRHAERAIARAQKAERAVEQARADERERVIAVSNSQELSFLERAEKAEAALDTLRTLLSHPQLRELLGHHRRLNHGECSCQSTYDHGALMDRDEWVAHVIDDAKSQRMIE